MKKIISFFFRALVILFALLSITLLFISIFKEEWIKSALVYIETIVEQIGNWNFFIAFISACVESIPIIGWLLPWMNIMLLVWWIWWKQYLILTIVMASIGAMLGNYFWFLIGKFYWEKLIRDYWDYVWIGQTERKILENQIEKNWFWYIVLWKFHWTLRSFIPFIAWAGKMAEKNFWLYNSVGSIIWAITINLLWLYFIAEKDMILDNMWKITTVILLLIALYFFIFRRDSIKAYWNEKNKEIEEKISKQSKNKK